MIDIYGTLGPACRDISTLEEMFRAGMTGIRLNLSHVTLKDAAAQVQNLHTAAKRAGVEGKLLIDMQGPELRVGAREKPLSLEEDSVIELKELALPEIAAEHIKKGQEILLDDGKILLKAESAEKALVLRGGSLSGRKSIALPGADIYPPTLTDTDLENIACAAEFGVSGLMQPFVRGRDDLEAVREALDKAGCSHIKLMAKIENMQGVEHIEELIPAADEIIIARGDLGNAMPLWKLPAAQKYLAGKCREAGRNFMVVTQMLSSMEHSPVPTRAEVSDIFNAVLDGASSVMVTGETAVGKYPVETIKYMKNTVESAREYLGY